MCEASITSAFRSRSTSINSVELAGIIMGVSSSGSARISPTSELPLIAGGYFQVARYGEIKFAEQAHPQGSPGSVLAELDPKSLVGQSPVCRCKDKFTR